MDWLTLNSEPSCSDHINLIKKVEKITSIHDVAIEVNRFSSCRWLDDVKGLFANIHTENA